MPRDFGGFGTNRRPFAHQLVERGRVDDRIAQGVDRVGPLVVGDHQQHVGTPRGAVRLGAGSGGQP